MRQFFSIVDAIKIHMERNKSQHVVFDHEVAIELGLSDTNLATRKKRNSIPFEELIIWCKNKEVDIMEILYE